LITTTVEDGDSFDASIQYKKIWDKSNPNEKLESGKTQSGLWRYFNPAYMGYYGEDDITGVPFIDEYGYSRQELAKEYILRNRQGLDDRQLASEKRKLPLTVEEAFQTDASQCHFNSINLHDQLTYLKEYAPKIITRTIPGNFIGALIGPGGKVIQELQKATGTTIVINEVDEQGVVEILGTDPAGIAAVLAKIDSITFKPQINEAYEVKVIKMLDFGAVVEYTSAPGNEVLLHVSELAWERTENVTDVVNMGDVFQVKYLGIDPKTKKEKVSRKALLPRPPRES
jgi:DNA-directed RNA polymerase subunit E'/Rpb7